MTDPAISKSFHAYNMMSPDGRCYSFDERANGYVRADGIGCVLIESSSIVGHGIMKILGTSTNSDGWKSEGITFPSSDRQISLCRSVCEENNIDPSMVRYVEAHGTGTTVGDKQELRAIDTIYGGERTPIGSIKSNMGHCEGASGILSLIKVLGILTERVIPANLNYTSTLHVPITSGRLEVVNTTRLFSDDPEALVAINNFGFGGTNAHVIGKYGGSC